MIKKHIKAIIAAALTTLLPCLFGVIFWDKLPDVFPTHFGPSGEADNFTGKAFSVFFIPVLLLVFFFICIFATAVLDKKAKQNDKAFSMVIWTIPLISVFVNAMLYMIALGKDVDPLLLMPVLMGVMFIIIGNYMPKCRQNFTLGIKIGPTLESKENWNATHRFAGKVWFFGGIILLFTALLPAAVLMITTLSIIAVLVILPIIFSYRFKNRQTKEGTLKKGNLPPLNRKAIIISVSVSVLILLGVMVLMFVGDIETDFAQDSFTVDSSFYNEISVKYDEIDSIELRDEFDPGSRVMGFGSARLLMGNFKNSEFGNYTLYAYTGADSCVVIRSGDKTLVITGSDSAETEKIYQELSAKAGK